MNDGKTQTMEIDFKDLLCFILKHIIVLVIGSVFFAFAGAGYSFYKQVNATPTPNALNTSVKLPGESEEAYINRVANVERAKDILDNISSITNQVRIQNDYLSSSVYMQIDPLNVATTKMQVVISCDNSSEGGLETLYNAYKEDIARGDYISSVADELGYSTGATQELISFTFESSDALCADSINQMGLMTISVVGDSSEITDLIMDAIVDEINAKSSEFDSSVIPHSLTYVGRQSSVAFDAVVRQRQFDTVNVLNSMQSQINSLNSNLDTTAKTLGLPDRNSFYETIDSENIQTTSVSPKGLIKLGLVGFALGLMLSAGICILIYVFGRRIVSQSQFFSLFCIQRIGVFKPLGKRTKMHVWLDQLSCDDTALSDETIVALISANLCNLSSCSKHILITSSVDSEMVNAAIKSLDVPCDIKLDLFSNPAILKNAADYDGIVIVEQRGVSRKQVVREQICLLKNSGTKIIGAIIL